METRILSRIYPEGQRSSWEEKQHVKRPRGGKEHGVSEEVREVQYGLEWGMEVGGVFSMAILGFGSSFCFPYCL